MLNILGVGDQVKECKVIRTTGKTSQCINNCYAWKYAEIVLQNSSQNTIIKIMRSCKTISSGIWTNGGHHPRALNWNNMPQESNLQKCSHVRQTFFKPILLCYSILFIFQFIPKGEKKVGQPSLWYSQVSLIHSVEHWGWLPSAEMCNGVTQMGPPFSIISKGSISYSVSIQNSVSTTLEDHTRFLCSSWTNVKVLSFGLPLNTLLKDIREEKG